MVTPWEPGDAESLPAISGVRRIASKLAPASPRAVPHLKNWLGVVPNCFLNMVANALGLS